MIIQVKPDSCITIINNSLSSGIHPTYSHKYYIKSEEIKRIKLRKDRINKLNKLKSII